MALGAGRRDVVALVVRQGAGLIAGGLVLGLIGSVALTGVLRGMLYGISAHDPVTLLAVAIALGVFALLACWLPALRASAVHPTEALRSE
jgi:ABC-type antimicrobial peptide transport system permease subunit